MKFSFSAKDYQKSCVVVEVIDRVPANIQKKQHKGQLPSDYWDFLGNDPELELLQQDSSSNKPNRRILSHSQVATNPSCLVLTLNVLFGSVA